MSGRIGWAVAARAESAPDSACFRDQPGGGLVVVPELLRDDAPGPPTDRGRTELNSIEAVWSHLKRSLANLAKRTIDQLARIVKTRLKRMRYRPSLIAGFIAKTGLDQSL